MSTEFMIEDWEALTQQFTKTFAGLGTILHNAEMASFTSKAPDVETGIAIYADGQFSATMPLHGIDSKISKVIFSQSAITLQGDTIDYTYRIPPEILRHRGE
tara:strand:+ start:1042 stop:1347 length:306 start_codon:yes stop_codon:yes gene_type:complete